MVQIKVSTIIATYNRDELLERSLYTYTQQTLPKEEFELIILNDGETDTWKILEPFKPRVNIIYVKMKREEHQKFRGQTVPHNLGLSLAIGEVAVFTHPEILMPPQTLEALYSPHLEFGQSTFLTMKLYNLSKSVQEMLDTVDWKSDLENIKKLPGFYTDPIYDGTKTYTNKMFEDPKFKWESNTTFSMKRIQLLNIGGFDEFNRWGPDDPSFASRRRKLKIATKIVPNLMNYHQNHEAQTAHLRKWDFRVKWYPTKASAKLIMKDHKGECEIVYSYRPT